ncbi:MAG: hypothetical protein JSR76_08365 [Verrucomicrobia bacterium]|nr:hypothetical protein [Verrucomicrobiota bacterium]
MESINPTTPRPTSRVAEKASRTEVELAELVQRTLTHIGDSLPGDNPLMHSAYLKANYFPPIWKNAQEGLQETLEKTARDLEEDPTTPLATVDISRKRFKDIRGSHISHYAYKELETELSHAPRVATPNPWM